MRLYVCDHIYRTLAHKAGPGFCLHHSVHLKNYARNMVCSYIIADLINYILNSYSSQISFLDSDLISQTFDCINMPKTKKRKRNLDNHLVNSSLKVILLLDIYGKSWVLFELLKLLYNFRFRLPLLYITWIDISFYITFQFLTILISLLKLFELSPSYV